MSHPLDLSGYAAEAATPTTPSLTSLHGRRVGPYQLQRELGRGGMGCVWLARRDDGQFEGLVAIKLLVASWLGPEGEIRFRREGSLLARLNHPNIARLLDAGVSVSGEPYMVLEYVEGKRIDEYCNTAGLGVRARVKLFLELLAAVAHAHRNLIVHRDVKPANVLVSDDGVLKLLDFGISKLVHDNDALQTRSGHTMLTPEYAAPEQLLGEPVTTATDIYALGLLLYLLLSGRLPFAEAQGSPAELIRRITAGAMPLPSSVAVSLTHVQSDASAVAQPNADRALRSELRGDLDNIVFKALHPTPEHRYQDAGAFAADLQHFLNHEPVSARAGNWLYRTAKFVRRNRLGVATAALVLSMAWVATSITIKQTMRAEARFEQAQLMTRTTEMYADMLSFTAFAAGGPDRPTLTPEEQIDRTADLFERVYSNDLVFAGRMMMQLAEYLPSTADTEIPMRLLRRASQLGDKSGDVETFVSSRCLLASRLVMSGAASEAATLIAQAARRLDDPGVREENVSHCMLARANLAVARGDPERGAALLREALTALEKYGLASRTQYTQMLSQLAIVYVQQSKFAAALEATERQASIERELGLTDTTHYLTSMQNRAQLLMHVGEIAKSYAERQQVVRLTRRFYAADGMPFPLVYNHAWVLLRMGRASEALAALDEYVDLARNAQNPPQLASLLQYKAWAHLELRQLQPAASALEEAQAIVQEGVVDANMTSLIAARWAELALGRNALASAREHIDEALSLAGYGKLQTQRALPRILLLAGEIALAAGRHADAEKLTTDALRMTERVARSPNSSADVGESLLLLDKIRAATDAPGTRRARLQRALQCLRNALPAEHPRVLEAAARLRYLS